MVVRDMNEFGIRLRKAEEFSDDMQGATPPDLAAVSLAGVEPPLQDAGSMTGPPMQSPNEPLYAKETPGPKGVPPGEVNYWRRGSELVPMQKLPNGEWAQAGPGMPSAQDPMSPQQPMSMPAPMGAPPLPAGPPVEFSQVVTPQSPAEVRHRLEERRVKIDALLKNPATANDPQVRQAASYLDDAMRSLNKGMFNEDIDKGLWDNVKTSLGFGRTNVMGHSVPQAGEGSNRGGVNQERMKQALPSAVTGAVYGEPSSNKPAPIEPWRLREYTARGPRIPKVDISGSSAPAPTAPAPAPTVPEQTPTSTEQTPASTEQTPTSTEQTPTSTEQTPTSTEHASTSTAPTPTVPVSLDRKKESLDRVKLPSMDPIDIDSGSSFRSEQNFLPIKPRGKQDLSWRQESGATSPKVESYGELREEDQLRPEDRHRLALNQGEGGRGVDFTQKPKDSGLNLDNQFTPDELDRLDSQHKNPYGKRGSSEGMKVSVSGDVKENRSAGDNNIDLYRHGSHGGLVPKVQRELASGSRGGVNHTDETREIYPPLSFRNEKQLKAPVNLLGEKGDVYDAESGGLVPKSPQESASGSRGGVNHTDETREIYPPLSFRNEKQLKAPVSLLGEKGDVYDAESGGLVPKSPQESASGSRGGVNHTDETREIYPPLSFRNEK